MEDAPPRNGNDIPERSPLRLHDRVGKRHVPARYVFQGLIYRTGETRPVLPGPGEPARSAKEVPGRNQRRYAKACGHCKSHCPQSQIPVLRRTELGSRPQNLSGDRRADSRHHRGIQHDHYHQHARHEFRNGHRRKHPVYI